MREGLRCRPSFIYDCPVRSSLLESAQERMLKAWRAHQAEVRRRRGARKLASCHRLRRGRLCRRLCCRLCRRLYRQHCRRLCRRLYRQHCRRLCRQHCRCRACRCRRLFYPIGCTNRNFPTSNISDARIAETTVSSVLQAIQYAGAVFYAHSLDLWSSLMCWCSYSYRARSKF